MGRPQKEVDMEALVDLMSKGFDERSVAGELGISLPTLQSRIKQLQDEEGVTLQYRSVRNLHLTQLQAKCLEAINPGKIAAASLRDLVMAFKVLHDAETETKDGGKVTGLVAYLMELEKETICQRTGTTEISNARILAMAKDVTETEEDALFRAAKELSF